MNACTARCCLLSTYTDNEFLAILWMISMLLRVSPYSSLCSFVNLTQQQLHFAGSIRKCISCLFGCFWCDINRTLTNSSCLYQKRKLQIKRYNLLHPAHAIPNICRSYPIYISPTPKKRGHNTRELRHIL